MSSIYFFGDIKIVDFGMFWKIGNVCEFWEIMGILEYLVLEILNYDFIIIVIDMWNIGIIVYMLLIYILLFVGEDN